MLAGSFEIKGMMDDIPPGREKLYGSEILLITILIGYCEIQELAFFLSNLLYYFCYFLAQFEVWP